MGDTSETQPSVLPSDSPNTQATVTTEEHDTNSQPESAIEKNVDKPADIDNSDSSTPNKSFDQADQTANAVLSDQESEAEQRNTSTSNAGESEYESANEEDIDDDFEENTPDVQEPSADLPTEPKVSVESSSSPAANDNSSSDVKLEEQKVIDEPAKENFDSPEKEESSKPAELDEPTDEEALLEQQALRVRRRKRRSKLSDDENDEESDEAVSDEEATEDIEEDEEDESFEADEGQLADDKSIGDVTDKALPDDERENGDGQESENQDGKSSKSASTTKSAKKGEIEDKRNPQYIPRKGPFYEHDDRIDEEPVVKPAEGEENEAEKVKSKKRLIASMKLRSDDMADDDGGVEVDKLSSKSVSKEQLPIVSSSPSVESSESVTGDGAKVDPKLPREVRKKGPLWDSKDRWGHDKFNVDDQKPKSRDELISTYGYDIRNEVEAPKLQRRSKYGKGPQKYIRRSEDDAAYAKKALRKVIPRSPRESRSEDTQRDSSESWVEKDSNSVMKKDQVFNNNKHLPPKKVISREPTTAPRLNNSKPNNFAESSSNRIHESRTHESRTHESRAHESRTNENRTNENRTHENRTHENRAHESRVHENRVFVNKSGHSHFREAQSSKSIENSDSRIENFHEPEPSERQKELFTNEDFPELVSAPTKAQPTNNDSPKNNKIIYYQHSTSPNSKNTDSSRSIRDTQHPSESSKDSMYDSDVARQSVPMVKSQLYENSRYTRSRNYVPNHEYNGNNNSNWNNNRPAGPSKSSQFTNHSNQPIKKPLNVTKEDMPPLSETNAESSASADTRPKRYSSIRQQQQRNVPVPSNNSSSNISTQPSTVYTSVSQTTAVAPQQYNNTRNADVAAATPNIVPTEVATKNSYYEQSTVNTANEIPPPPHQAAPNLMPTGHHHATHNYAPINGPTPGGAAGTTYGIPTQTPLMAYYDPNAAAANGQTTGTPAPSLQAPPPLGLTAPTYHFTTDQTGAAQTVQTAPNYYLTTADLTAVAYHPAYHLQAPNYPQPLPTHHTHQSHVTNRYLNTTPANAPSAESNRYLAHTVPTTQNSAPILVGPSQAYQQAIQPAFPSGYPQFPPVQPANTPSLGTSSPLPAGYPNVPMGNSGSATPVPSAPQQTPSGYPELYRGGITYYDIQSQQQAMRHHQHHQLQQNITHHHQTRRGKGDNPDDGDVAGSKHPAAKNEISVSN